MSNSTLVDPSKSIPLLTESNYQTWKYSMQARLMQSTVSWLVVKGEISPPGPETTPEDQKQYQIANLSAAGLIYASVSPSLQPFIQDHIDNAKVMWDTLESHLQQKNATACMLIVSELLSITKQPDESLSALIGCSNW